MSVWQAGERKAKNMLCGGLNMRKYRMRQPIGGYMVLAAYGWEVRKERVPGRELGRSQMPFERRVFIIL